MSVIGLWHGASWSFIIWGLLHGIYMSMETAFNVRSIPTEPDNLATTVVKTGRTFLLVSFAWIFFRAQSISDAGYIIANLFNFDSSFARSFSVYGTNSNEYGMQFLISLTCIVLLLSADWVDEKWGIFNIFKGLPTAIRFGLYYALILLIFGVLISAPAIQNFVYFQF